MKLDELQDKPEIIVCVGLPGSGKSTWIKNFLTSTNKKFNVVSSDDILERIARNGNKTYNDVHKDHIGGAEKEMNSNANLFVKNKMNIIWDQTNMGAKKRSKILNRVGKDYYKIAVIFQVDDEELNKRLKERELNTGKRIPPEVIEQMKQSYQEPSKSEGFDEIIKV